MTHLWIADWHPAIAVLLGNQLEFNSHKPIERGTGLSFIPGKHEKGYEAYECWDGTSCEPIGKNYDRTQHTKQIDDGDYQILQILATTWDVSIRHEEKVIKKP